MISFIVAFFALIITSHLVIDGGSSSAEVRVKFKVLHGRIIDSSKEVNGTYFIFLNMRSFREDFAPWLVYMALAKDYDWWGKKFSDRVAKAAQLVKEVFQRDRILPLKTEDVYEHRREIAATIHEWWFANLWEKVIGSCVSPFYIEVMIGDEIYGVFHTHSHGCIEQYRKVLELGGRFDLIVIWVGDELKPVQGDFKTITGWSSIYSLDSGLIKKLLKVIEFAGF